MTLDLSSQSSPEHAVSHVPSSSVHHYDEPIATFSPSDLITLNNYLSTLEPKEILTWALHHCPGLYQTTAFGLTGCVILDMISEISHESKRSTTSHHHHLVDVIFIDTLYHFQETLDVARQATQRVGATLHTFKPLGSNTTHEFESIVGQRLWESDEETYDFLVKVEPARRAYGALNVQSVITGRRRSQGATRSNLEILQIDETGLVKLNPLAAWSFTDVWDYIQSHHVPYNALVDRGYRSVGDWHSTTVPTGVESSRSRSNLDSDERSGRWGGRAKTECGLHQDYFKMKRLYEKKKRERELAERDERRDAELAA